MPTQNIELKRLHMPPLPMGYLPTYFDSRRFNLAGLGKSFNFTPRIAKPYQSYYIDRGCTTVNINAGYASGPSGHVGEYTALQRANRSVFLGPEYIQDANGGKHFSDLNLSDCRNSANYAYNRANGYGVITSGAQEGRFDNDYWAQLTSSSLSAYKNLSQAWGEIMAANPGCVYFGCYDGILYFNVNDNPATLRTALSSNANALAYMLANSYGPNPYFSQELWRYHPPLLNLYFRSYTDLSAKNFEARMAIQLTKMALAAVGASWPVMSFVFGLTEFVDYPGHGYSEKYERDTSGGGTYHEYNFPQYSHAFQWDQTFTALNNADAYYGWQDTQIYGTNPDLVPPDILRGGDNFPLRKKNGGSVTSIPMGPTPYNAAVTYPYPSSYEGAHDIAPIAAEHYAYMVRYGGQNTQLARHRKSGTSTFCSLDSSYFVDRFVNREAVVDFARTGNLGWVKISDYVSEQIGPYDLDIDIGSGNVLTVPVEPHGINAFTFNLNP